MPRRGEEKQRQRPPWILGLVDDAGEAQRSLAELCDAGFSLSDVSLLLSEDTRRRAVDLSSPIGQIAAGMTAAGAVAAVEESGGRSKLLIAGPLASEIAQATAPSGVLERALNAIGVEKSEAHDLVARLDKGAIALAVRAAGGDIGAARRVLHSGPNGAR